MRRVIPKMKLWTFFNSVHIENDKTDFIKFHWQLEARCCRRLRLCQNNQLERENWLAGNRVYRERHTANIAATNLIVFFPEELSEGKNVQ